MELPPPLGRARRDPIVLLVTGRTAVSRIGGMTAVGRHVATAIKLGLEPMVLFPPSMRALGAEIAGELDGRARSMPADTLGDQAGGNDDLVLVVAADWYISPRATMEFVEETDGRAVARFKERNREVAPLARLPVKQLRRLIDDLADNASGEIINRACGREAAVFTLDVSQRHRLSDNVAVERAETKLFGRTHTNAAGPELGFVQKRISIPITRRLAGTRVVPMHVCAAKVALGLASAWVLAGGGYMAGLVGAVAFFFSQVLDGVASQLARATLRDSSQGEKADFASDIILHLALLWALATATGTTLAAAVAAVGLLVSAWLAHSRVLARLWALRAAGRLYQVAPDPPASRFANREGTAYGLLLAALVARFDLFLLAAALVNHMVYAAAWLLTERGRRWQA
ncbi:MAG: hypothetical protein VCA74_08410 [Deltaproteobacteria bacterium]